MTAPRIVHPADLSDACRLLAELGPGARILAGGTDALVKIRAGAPAPPAWVDISRLGGALREIALEGDRLRIGALVNFDAIERDEAVRRVLPAMTDAARVMGCRQVRIRGTVGGNLCNASPAGDGIVALIAGGATAVLVSSGGTRELPVEDLYLGPGKTCLRPDEVLAGVSIPVLPGARSGFLRVGSRAQHDISKVSTAIRVRFDGERMRDVRVALGAVAPVPQRARATERVLEGQALSSEVLAAAAAAARSEVTPIDDVRSTAAYRRDMSGELVVALLRSLSQG